MRRLAAAVAALVLAALLVSGCASTFETDIQMDRRGRGTVTLTLTLDQGALQSLGLSTSDPNAIATRLQPLLLEGGWEPAEGGESVQQNVFSYSADSSGGVTLRTRKRFDNVAALKAIISTPRNLRAITGETLAPSVFAGLTDLPSEAPLINEFTVRLGTGTGDNPGFYVFGRGGVGSVDKQTCAGGRVESFSKALRDALQFHYRLKAPGGPGSTNATQISDGASVWLARYGDCPRLTAESGGGSSSTLANGLVLAVLVGILAIIFIARAVRRRGRTRRSQGPPPPADEGGLRE